MLSFQHYTAIRLHDLYYTIHAVSSRCTISDPLMVSPFNASRSYNFRGTCELVALMSCSGAEPGFSVRVDFLSNTGSNGAVGVYKDGQKWISSEDGSFSSDANSTSSSPEAGVMLFADNQVTVRMNTSLSRTEIEVGGSINVMVVHNYGGEFVPQQQLTGACL